MKRNPRQKLDPKDATNLGVDNSGTLWVDGNARGIKTKASSNSYRVGWERTFGKRKNCTH